MKRVKGWIGTGAWLAALWAATSGTSAAQIIVPPPYTLVIYVNAATGLDTNTGGINDPLKSINKALQKAYDFRFQPGDPMADPPEPPAVDNPNWRVVIRLVASTKPFGPVGGMTGPGNPGNGDCDAGVAKHRGRQFRPTP